VKIRAHPKVEMPTTQDDATRLTRSRRRTAAARARPKRRSSAKVDKPRGHEPIWAQTDRYVGKILHIRR
jgi:hypothetical protein